MKLRFCGYSFHNQKYHTYHMSSELCYLFRLQTEGTAIVKINKKNHPVKKGDLLMIKPNERYELYVNEEQTSGDLHLYCEGNWIHDHFKHMPPLISISMDDLILQLWHHLIIEERRPYIERNHSLTDHLLSALCISLEREMNRTDNVSKHPFIVMKMMRFVEENATKQNFQVQELADSCDLSISRCVHLFKEHTGMTIIEYAQSIRLSSAINQMKYTTNTLESIALNCGFSSYSYFHRLFTRKYQLSPRNYRNQL